MCNSRWLWGVWSDPGNSCCAATPTRSSIPTSSPGRPCARCSGTAWRARRRSARHCRCCRRIFATRARSPIWPTPCSRSSRRALARSTRRAISWSRALRRKAARCVCCPPTPPPCALLLRLPPPPTATRRNLEAQTRPSVQHAIIVLRDEDKPAAREHFRSPLVFSVHEAKGLEYPHVILYTLVSGQRAAYAEVCDGVTQAELQVEQLAYSRARDKGDKSL